MAYIQYSFHVNPIEPGTDILIALLSEFDFESFSNTEFGFDAYIQKELDNPDLIQEIQLEDIKFSYITKEIAKQNWNEEWEKNFSPVFVEDLCCIRAGFHQAPEKIKYDIVITPKMSFGTGHHDTTWLMCKSMTDMNFKGKKVLDMGCGTGVLAILAKKLGATEITGIDIEDWSVENAIENSVINQAEDIVYIHGDALLLSETKPYDIILANINKNILKQDMSIYYRTMKNNGILLLSGFFTVDIAELKQEAEKCGFKYIDSYSKNEWAVIKLEK